MTPPQPRLPASRLALDYPMSLKDHGVDFALDHRHLWIRMQSQWAILRVRVRVMSAVREYLDEFQEATRADELIVVHQAESVADRLRSIEMVAPTS